MAKKAVSTMRTYRNITDHTINVDAKPVEAGAVIEIPSNLVIDLGVEALECNGYLKEVTD